MALSITFHGAAGTVTGSKHLIELPSGQRLCGHAQLREAFGQLLGERAVHCDAIETTTQASLGMAIFETVEAMRFDTATSDAEAFVHNTYVLMQHHDGWRIAHLHSSPAHEVTLSTSAMTSHALH